jgi:multicomponent Na+:H+ antiporter subunit E
MNTDPKTQSSASSPRNFRGLVNLWVTLFAIWLMANSSLSRDVIITGLVVVTVLTLTLSSFARTYADIHLSPKAVLYYFLYLGVFLWELFKANLNLLRIVFSPKIDIRPGIVKINTRLKSATGRMVLANSITLTPGTLVVDVSGDALYVHWIDVTAIDAEEATQRIAAKFEKYLEVIYG